MMRALYSAALGMKAQQTNVDIISNNLANVNTTAFKKDKAEFKDLLYETLSRADVVAGDGKPVSLQIGHGVTISAITKSFAEGNLERTENPLDLAIQGEGFFVVSTPNGPRYTRDGSFKVSNVEGQIKLVTSDGYPVLAEGDTEIVLPETAISSITIDETGRITYKDQDGQIQDSGFKIKIVRFINPQGLLAEGKNLYNVSATSGDPVSEEEMEGQKSRILQGFLEMSNVQVVDEMVKLIIAQRAYEINSKAIQTADDMLSMANNLKR
ncbi:flagellar basal-body rod protein FlgG [Caldicellulosiruptor hydrothermalis 108]|uniref:Flagellar basal-body rod protein FlgG n=1 Tax=Caldicellulosiruptor hydrothermalis (strain DSM 18901 / VKM B-2411 / 108) TaxID=632292 RepID=E4QAM2_CALH1|nr:flagellar basal-body rod protein FlgG [Caldicellulosiruptor hydrothermalis]ADQ05947.1 flagellar basal-body rod protein FlgG [Caldicellulosiruptor hydrothermalis 108]